jgi:hypothetical protein
MGYDTPAKRWHQRRKLLVRWPAKALSILLAPRRMLYVYKWLVQNQTFTNFLRDHRLDHLLMTYRDLATNTTGELERLMPWLGLKFEPGQIEYWNFEHHGTQKSEYEWIKEKKGSYFDTRWKSFLTPQEQQDFVAHPLVREYLQDIGVAVNEQGLTRIGQGQEAAPQRAR